MMKQRTRWLVLLGVVLALLLTAIGVCVGSTGLENLMLLLWRADVPTEQAASSLWVSPAARAQQLATALLSRRRDLQGPNVDMRLREMDFGVWELQPWSEIPREAIDAWTADFAHHRFGGNECTQEVIDRVAQALDETLSQSVPETVWITHAGVIRAVQFLQAGGYRSIHSANDWPVTAPSMGEWICVDI